MISDSYTKSSKEAKEFLNDFTELIIFESLELFCEKLGNVDFEKFFEKLEIFIKVSEGKITFLVKREACECEEGEYWDDWNCRCDIETLDTYVFDVSNTFEDFIKCIVTLKDCSGIFHSKTLAIWDMSELTDAGIKSVPEDDYDDMSGVYAPTVIYREPLDLPDDLPDDLEEMPPPLPESLPDDLEKMPPPLPETLPDDLEEMPPPLPETLPDF